MIGQNVIDYTDEILFRATQLANKHNLYKTLANGSKYLEPDVLNIICTLLNQGQLADTVALLQNLQPSQEKEMDEGEFI